MSVPPNPGQQQGPPAGGAGRMVVLGIVVGLLVLAGLVALNFVIPPTEALGLLLWVPFVVYFVVAVFITALQRSTYFGAGMLIAIGIALLLGAGVCFAVLAGIGQGI